MKEDVLYVGKACCEKYNIFDVSKDNIAEQAVSKDKFHELLKDTPYNLTHMVNTDEQLLILPGKDPKPCQTRLAVSSDNLGGRIELVFGSLNKKDELESTCVFMCKKDAAMLRDWLDCVLSNTKD